MEVLRLVVVAGLVAVGAVQAHATSPASPVVAASSVEEDDFFAGVDLTGQPPEGWRPSWKDEQERKQREIEKIQREARLARLRPA